jgi:hypothetical protein
MADDLGWGDVAYNGNRIVQTPHLDSMSREGVRLDRFYAAAPVCSPTRGSCLTGRHPFRYGIAWAGETPIKGKDILIYSNCDSPKGRHHGTIWASFDGGKTWPLKRLVHEGGFAYSSLTAGRPGTPSEGTIYLHFESGGSKVARFNLSWLLGGKTTGDGQIPTEYKVTDR